MKDTLQILILVEIFDVILLDLVLKDAGKMETLQEVRDLRKASDAPLIVLSGVPDPNLREESLAAGADAFLEKNLAASKRGIAVLMAVHAAILKHPKAHPNDSYLEHVALLEKLVHSE